MAERQTPDIFRPGGITYLRIPAADPQRDGAFYAAVFGWTVDSARDEPSFADAGGHVIGHFVADQDVAGESGVRPYVSVASVERTLAAVLAHGGEIVTAPYPEGNLTVATFRDPAGNVLGVWQQTGAA